MLIDKKLLSVWQKENIQGFPEIAASYGDIDFELVKKIASQVPEGCRSP